MWDKDNEESFNEHVKFKWPSVISEENLYPWHLTRNYEFLIGCRIETGDWFSVFNATSSNIMVTSFSGGRSRNSRREPPTIGKQLVNLSFATASRVHLFCNLQSRVRTHALLVVGLYELLGNPTHWATRSLGLKRVINETNHMYVKD